MKKIGIGESDFKGLMVRDNYYIDKTMYIKHIIDNESRVILITRPRRFGKTLNMSTLKYYFDCTQKDSKELFKGLKILDQEEKYTSKLGYYPVIYVKLKDAGIMNYNLMIMQLKTIEDTIKNAKKQIEEKGYEANLKEKGYTNITKIVFAFRGKEVKMEVY